MENERLEPPPLTLLDRYRGQGFTALYTTTVTVSGGTAEHGRASGVVRSDDGNLMLDLRLPAAKSCSGLVPLPCPPSAAGFAACFHGALSLVAKRAHVDVAAMTVAVEVAFGRDPADGGYALIADVRIRLPGVERHVAEELVRNTERMCPYAKMAREGMRSVIAIAN